MGHDGLERERAAFIRSLRTRLRDYFDAIVREPMSQRWVDLMHILMERDRQKMRGSGPGQVHDERPIAPAMEAFMGVEQDLAAADAYIRQANRRIAKERALADRTANPETKATVRDLIEVLTILRANVEDRQRYLLTASKDRP